MNAPHRMLATTVLVAAALAAPLRAAEPKLPRDGWVSWDVPAVENAPAWCCFDWSDRVGTPKACKLDGHSNGFSARDHQTTDTVTVYARAVAGKIDRVRLFAASCPVEARAPIQELTDVTVDDSARWLRDHATGPLTDDALGALAMHRGDFARDSLVTLGKTDATAGARSKAWFWLAMTAAKDAETPIAAALRSDPDAEVREQAVFALSRLPDARATRALIATAEDKSLPREQRKRAVFWLSQSESTAALAYLDRILAAAAPARQ